MPNAGKDVDDHNESSNSHYSINSNNIFNSGRPDSDNLVDRNSEYKREGTFRVSTSPNNRDSINGN